MNKIFLTWGFIFFAALFDSYASLVVKLKFNELGHIDYSSFRSVFAYIVKFVQSPLLVTALIAFVSAPALWFFALNRIDLSIGYPVLVGFHLIFVLVFGIVFLGEGVTLNKILGVCCVFLSLYFFYRN